MTPTPTNSSNDKESPFKAPSSINKKGRKPIDGQKLQFSPRVRTPNTNKVYVVGATMGLILMKTQRQTNNDDAFTHTANLMIEDPDTGAAARLNIIKIFSRCQSQMIDKAILQSTAYHSQWYVTLVDEELNTYKFCKDHAENFIKFLNDTKWKFAQTFTFAGDEPRKENGIIAGTWDMYCLNSDIATILKNYMYDDMGDFMEDTNAVANVFGPGCTSKDAGVYLKDFWIEDNK